LDNKKLCDSLIDILYLGGTKWRHLDIEDPPKGERRKKNWPNRVAREEGGGEGGSVERGDAPPHSQARRSSRRRNDVDAPPSVENNPEEGGANEEGGSKEVPSARSNQSRNANGILISFS